MYMKNPDADLRPTDCILFFLAKMGNQSRF